MKVALSSGRRVEIVERGKARAVARERGAPLFSEVTALLESGAVELRGAMPGELALADFHALRAILTQRGFLAEEPVELTCRNCDTPIEHRPCAEMKLGPFEDAELDDPELDATLPLGVPHPIPAVKLVGGRRAETVTFEARTAGQAAPLHAALARKRLAVTPSVVRAMGIAALGDQRAPDRIARALGTASEAAWNAVGDLFLQAHYPPRLFSAAACPACGARNDVDAPYEREFEPITDGPRERDAGASNAEAFPSFDEFDRAAHAVAEGEFARRNAGGVAFVVEGGVAACDDGGEPLLGCYVPGHPGDATTPSRSPAIAVFFRTFRAIDVEEGPFDWRAELEETVAHELDHHFADLAGDDPVDDDERAEIAREAARIHGKRALARGELGAFGRDVATFLRRTWPIWLLLALATIAVVMADVR